MIPKPAPPRPLPVSMRAARLYDIDDIRIESLPVPELEPGDLLIETSVCGICTGELMPWYVRQKAPFVFGHEPVGRVIAVGEGGDPNLPPVEAGDRVFVHHHAPCLVCRHCLRGEHVQCETWRNTRLDPGAMAEVFRVPAANRIDVLRLPPSVSDEDGALVEPAACAVKALDLADVRPGDTVLVIGLGFMGQILARLARAYGAGTVIGSDFVPARRELARRLGADAVIDPAAGPLPEQVEAVLGRPGADVVVVAPPTARAMSEGIAAAGRGGRVVLFSPAPPGEQITVEPHHLYFHEIRLIPSYSCGPLHTRKALGYIAAGVLRAADLVTHRYPFERVAEAYAAMQRGDVLKATVHFTSKENEA